MPRRSALAATLLALLPAAALAQPSIAIDVMVASSYVWRGLTVTNRPVVQPELSAAWGPDGALSGGIWGNVEPARYDGPTHISEVDGHGPDVTELQLWLEYGATASGVELALGANRYVYPNDVGVTAASNTTELYGTVTLPAPLAPALTLAWDVGTVRGAYAELALHHERALSPRATLALDAAAGANLGQGPDAAGRDEAYFAERGLTHVDLGASVALSIGQLAVRPTVHLLLARDPLTRATAPERTRTTKGWIGATIGWARSDGGA